MRSSTKRQKTKKNQREILKLMNAMIELKNSIVIFNRLDQTEKGLVSFKTDQLILSNQRETEKNK